MEIINPQMMEENAQAITPHCSAVMCRGSIGCWNDFCSRLDSACWECWEG